MKVLTLNKPKIKDFSKERNRLLKYIKDGEWVLFVDMDEKISSDINLSKYLKETLVKKPNLNAFYLIRNNYFLGQYVGKDRIIRLIKKGSGKWVRAVHERWIPKSENLVGYLDIPVIIHNTSSTLSMYLNKINKYSTIHALENKNEGKKVNLIKIITYPLLKFITTYIKSRNVVFSIIQSLHSFLSWSKMYLATKYK